MSPPDAEVPYGTLDLMVLKTLQAMSPLHGYGIARRIAMSASTRLSSGRSGVTTGPRASALSSQPSGPSCPPRPAAASVRNA